jgi:membrane-associated phospholipid phosphatase
MDRGGDSRAMEISRRMRLFRCFAILIVFGLLASFGATDLHAQGTESQPAINESLQAAGDVGQYAATVAGLALIAARHDRRGLTQDALATATTLVILHTLKPIINRTRPDGGGRSFPSGHTAMAFAGAGFLQRRYGWAYGLPAYAFGTFVAYTRVHTRQHYTSDCVAGGALGIAANLAFTHRWRGKDVAVTPLVGERRAGLALSAVW